MEVSKSITVTQTVHMKKKILEIMPNVAKKVISQETEEVAGGGEQLSTPIGSVFRVLLND